MKPIQATQEERLLTLARGAVAGLIAGTIFALAEMAASSLAGQGPMFPIRMAASVWLAHRAFTEAMLPVFLYGVGVHIAISLAYGMLASMLYDWSDWSRHARLGMGPMVSVGAAYGMFVWLIDLDVIAGNFLPWIWRAHQPAQFLLHSVFFGVPLGVSLVGLAVTMRSSRAGGLFRTEPR